MVMTELSFYEGYLEGKRRQDEIAKKAASVEAESDWYKTYMKLLLKRNRLWNARHKSASHLKDKDLLAKAQQATKDVEDHEKREPKK
jgi:hypothetical protein